MVSSAVRALGLVQCVYWGVLYYAFSVLLLPLAGDLGVGTAWIAGAFSAGLALAALVAPAIGRALDRGAGVVLMRAGALATPALLLAWSAVDALPALYAVWLALGLCMGLVLYEPAFALVTRAIADPQRRLQALATVTIAGGLASTAFLPAVGWSVRTLGWRDTLWLLALVWLLATWVLERAVLRRLDAEAAPARAPAPERPSQAAARPPRPAVLRLAVPFLASTFAGMVLTTLAIPLLVGAGQRIDHAATALAAFGVMQLPGRIWLARARAVLPGAALLLGPPLLQIAGLGMLALAPSTSMPLAAAMLGIALFGLGAGVHTVSRPWLVAQLHGPAMAGTVNGRIAALQGIARAAGPVLAAALMLAVGARAAMLASAVLLVLALVPAWATVRLLGADPVRSPAGAHPAGRARWTRAFVPGLGGWRPGAARTRGTAAPWRGAPGATQPAPAVSCSAAASRRAASASCAGASPE